MSFNSAVLREKVFEESLVMTGKTSFFCSNSIKITRHFQVEDINNLNLAMFDSICDGMTGEN